MGEGDSVDEDDPELSCFCLVSSGGSAFHVSILRLLTEAPAGMPSRPVMMFAVHSNLHFGISGRDCHLGFLMKTELVHSFWNLRRRLKSLWTRVLKPVALGAGFTHEARVLRPLTWRNSNLGRSFQTRILQLLFTQQRDGNFRRLKFSASCAFRRGRKLRPRLKPVCSTVLTRVCFC